MKKREGIDCLDELNLHLACINPDKLKLPYNVYIVPFHVFKKWGLQPGRENVEMLHLFTMNPVGYLKTGV